MHTRKIKNSTLKQVKFTTTSDGKIATASSPNSKSLFGGIL